jgi:hypothetical protein
MAVDMVFGTGYGYRHKRTIVEGENERIVIQRSTATSVYS